MKSFKVKQVNAYFPPHLGGAPQRIKELSFKLAEKGNKVDVFTSDLDCPKGKQLKSTKNLKIHYLKSKRIFHTPLIPSLYKELIKDSEGSIIHVHTAQAYTPEVVLLASKIRKIPYIAHIRGDSPPTGKLGFLLSTYKKIFLKNVLKNSGKVICLNEDYKNLINERYNISKKKIVVIPNATNFKIINEKDLKFKRLRYLLFVGRFTSEKNIPYIIEALHLIKNKEIILKLAGEGEDKPKLLELVKRLGLEKKVIFLGELYRKRLYKEYLKSDLVILPSKVECFSSVLLESMATGVPIIASDIPGTRSVIKNGYNGLLVEPTPEKIAEAIEKLIKNPKLRETLARNGLKEVKKYSWDKIVEQTEKVYEEVLREHNKKLKQKKK